jgi:hypothetical protein
MLELSMDCRVKPGNDDFCSRDAFAPLYFVTIGLDPGGLC